MYWILSTENKYHRINTKNALKYATVSASIHSPALGLCTAGSREEPILARGAKWIIHAIIQVRDYYHHQPANSTRLGFARGWMVVVVTEFVPSLCVTWAAAAHHQPFQDRMGQYGKSWMKSVSLSPVTLCFAGYWRKCAIIVSVGMLRKNFFPRQQQQGLNN